jgi:hypothetical protein
MRSAWLIAAVLLTLIVSRPAAGGWFTYAGIHCDTCTDPDAKGPCIPIGSKIPDPDHPGQEKDWSPFDAIRSNDIHGRKYAIQHITTDDGGNVTSIIIKEERYESPFVYGRTKEDCEKAAAPLIEKSKAEKAEVDATAPPAVAAKPTVSASNLPQHSPRRIGLRYDQIMYLLDQFFPTMEKSTVDYDGVVQDSYSGRSTNGLALLEVIGDKSNISSATLLLGIPKDAPDIIIENTASLIRFTKNIDPSLDGNALLHRA